MLPDNLPKVLMKDMGLISRPVSTAVADFSSFSFSLAPTQPPPLFVCVGVFFMAVCVAVCVCVSALAFVAILCLCVCRVEANFDELEKSYDFLSPSLSLLLSLSFFHC